MKSLKQKSQIFSALVFVGLIAITFVTGFQPIGTALAKGGVSGGGGGGSTLIAGQCVTISAFDSGKFSTTDEVRFKATSCSSNPQTVTSTVADTSNLTGYPDLSCGTFTYAGPTMTLAPGQSQTYSITSRYSGVCNFLSSETHNVRLDVLGSDGNILTSGYTSWYEPSRAEGI